MFCLYKESKVVQLTEAESKMVVVRVWKHQGMGIGYRGSVLQNEKVLEHCECTQNYWTVPVK